MPYQFIRGIPKLAKQLFMWATAGKVRDRALKDASEKLQMSIRTTAKCRYNASVRLQSQGKFSFFTTTALSLGLIFIPLMQNSGVPLAFEASVLNMMQIFLAVAVLVYSVVIGTARYDMRAEQLTECGDKLKELTRKMDKERLSSGGTITAESLGSFQSHYSDIVTDVENHVRNDYRFASLEMMNDFFITGLPRLQLYLTAQIVRFLPYILPLTLMLMEVIFISDMMGRTEIFTPYLNGKAVKEKKNLPSSICNTENTPKSNLLLKCTQITMTQ